MRPVSTPHSDRSDLNCGSPDIDLRELARWQASRDARRCTGGTVLARDGLVARLYVQPAPNGAPSPAQSIARFQRLRPHLARAVDIALRIDEGAVWRAHAGELSEEASAGLLLLDGRGRVREMNRRALLVLAARDALEIRGDMLRALRPGDDRHLQRLIAGAVALASGAAAHGGGELLLARRLAPFPYRVIIRAAPRGSARLAIDCPAATVRVQVPDAAGEVDPERVAPLFCLTPRQAEVATRIARGENLADIATALGLERGTVRIHLERAMARLRVHRRSDLVAMLVGAAPLCRIDS